VEGVYENLRGFVGGVQQSYAQYYHARHGTSGVFWHGRFKSKPFEIGLYLGSCGRYIERNPVRAGMAAMAWEYRIICWAIKCYKERPLLPLLRNDSAPHDPSLVHQVSFTKDARLGPEKRRGSPCSDVKT